ARAEDRGGASTRARGCGVPHREHRRRGSVQSASGTRSTEGVVKPTRLLAIVAAVAGVAFIAWLATRPRGTTAGTLGEGRPAGGTTCEGGERAPSAGRATPASGGALTEAAAGVA